MVVRPLEGAFLKMTAGLVGAKRVLEIGTFTAYSALCFAEALPDNGLVITCDIDPESTALAQRYFAKSPNYLNYYRRALDLLAPCGVILIDNVLWAGDVLQQPPSDASTAVIQDLNRLIAGDTRVTAVLVTIRDGIYVIRRNGG
jgi:caffeoyl-CoA O-methyltransferase